MKFLVDAQLPTKLAEHLSKKGFDVKHVIELPLKDSTSDHEISRIADLEDRIVITKDEDFVNGFVLRKIPKKLLYVSTGNIDNKTLLSLFDKNLLALINNLEKHDFVEMDNTDVIVNE